MPENGHLNGSQEGGEKGYFWTLKMEFPGFPDFGLCIEGGEGRKGKRSTLNKAGGPCKRKSKKVPKARQRRSVFAIPDSAIFADGAFSDTLIKAEKKHSNTKISPRIPRLNPPFLGAFNPRNSLCSG